MKSRLSTLLLLAATVAGCRGQISSEPPIHLNPNMDSQPRYDAQAESAFFSDHRTMRPPVAGTVPVGMLREDDAMYQGKNGDGSFVKLMPMTVSRELLDRGEQQYDIYCAPCHSPIGDGLGMAAQRGKIIGIPSYTEQRLLDAEDGYLFDVITHGKNRMSGYAYQIQPEDRWAIVAYVRTIQFTRRATQDVAPPAQPGGVQ